MKKYLLVFLVLIYGQVISAQQITGYWKGKIGTGIKNKKLELKLVLKGDSIVGTSYYYESKSNYKRYSIKGYFNPRTNAVIWWDDILLESKQPKLKLLSPGEVPFIAEADFNCPGGGIMMLDGKTKPLEKENSNGEKIHLDKMQNTGFEDEWNLVIDNWMDGGNDISFIDSIQQIAFNKPEFEVVKPLDEISIKQEDPVEKVITPKTEPVVILEVPVKKGQPRETVTTEPVIPKENRPIEFLDLSKPDKKITVPQKDTVPEIFAEKEMPLKEVPALETIKTEPPKKQILVLDTIEQTIVQVIQKPKPKDIEIKFEEREKIVLMELPVAADSILLHFYDNAQVDGDSISLFLNNVLLVEHIRLTDKPYIVVINKEQLSTAMELTMVAENLGAIPPNTSYMVAFVNGKKYDATLSSTEKSSAVIRFKK